MLLVGAAILIGAFFAFREEKKSEETTAISDRPATQPGAGEEMEVDGDPEPKKSGKTILPPATPQTPQARQQVIQNQLNKMEHAANPQQAFL